jgi:hypothetical protein
MSLKPVKEYSESNFISDLRILIYEKGGGGTPHGPSCNGLTNTGSGPCNCGSNGNTGTNCKGCGSSSTFCQ